LYETGIPENEVTKINTNKTDSKEKFLLCIICNNKTRTKAYQHTTLTNFPLYCPKCKHETIVNVENLNVTVIKEPDVRRRADNM